VRRRLGTVRMSEGSLAQQLKAALRGIGSSIGRIRQSDDTMTGAGISRGDLALVDLDAKPIEGQPCAAFTAYGELMLRRYHKLPKGEVLLTSQESRRRVKTTERFARGAVVIFGPVVRVEKGGD
jgi:SOS-response transcriptional repressor LexA